MGRSRVEQVEKRTAATPLAEDVLQTLRNQITGGTFGEGFGPLQREAGTAIRQFVNASSTLPSRFENLANPLIQLSRRETERGAANLREGFGIAGSRFGTTAARGEGLFRGEAQGRLDATLAGLMNQMFEQEQNRMLQGISEMFKQGQANLAPFIALTELGVLSPDTVVHPSRFREIVEPIAGLAQGIGEIVPG